MPENRVLNKDVVLSACRKLGVQVMDGGEEDGMGFILLNCSHAFEDLINALLPLVPEDVKNRILAGGPSASEAPENSWSFELHLGQDENESSILSYVYVEIPLLSDLESVVGVAGRLVSVPDVLN
jgi:hypothetical protein